MSQLPTLTQPNFDNSAQRTKLSREIIIEASLRNCILILMCTRPKSPTDLHTLGHVDFSVEHVPEQRRQKVLRVEQGDEDPRELVHLL